MKNNQTAKNQPLSDSEKDNKKEISETLREARQDSAAKDAEKKEKQPRVPDDLSPLHNTREVGTSGGDQRANETETMPK